MAYLTQTIPMDTITTASTGGQIASTIDLRQWDSFCLMFRNLSTVPLTDCRLQLAVGNSESITASVGIYIAANTGTIPVPSALGATSVTLTSAIFNCYRTARIFAHASTTITAGNFELIIGGQRRY